VLPVDLRGRLAIDIESRNIEVEIQKDSALTSLDRDTPDMGVVHTVDSSISSFLILVFSSALDFSSFEAIRALRSSRAMMDSLRARSARSSAALNDSLYCSSSERVSTRLAWVTCNSERRDVA
jgi:hypothetical protein